MRPCTNATPASNDPTARTDRLSTEFRTAVSPPLRDHALHAIVNDVRIPERHARPRQAHRLPATCGNAQPQFTGGIVLCPTTRRDGVAKSHESPDQARISIGPRSWRSASTRFLVDEPAQLDRGFLTLDVKDVETTGPPVEPARRRPSAFGQVGFLVLVGRVVGNELKR